MKKTVSLILLALLIILVVIFTLQNSGIVSVKFFSYEFSNSLSLILFLTLVTGMLIAILILMPAKVSDNKTIKKLTKKTTALEKEIEKIKKELEEAKNNRMENVDNDETLPKSGMNFENNLLANT